MRLHAHSVDAATGGFQPAYQPAHGIAPARGRHGVVVVVEFGIRVGFMGRLEGYLDEVFSDDAVEGRTPPTAVVFKSFVDDIPSAHLPLVTSHYGVDMAADACDELFACGGLAFLVGKEPWRGLRVPHQAVSHDALPVPSGKLHQFVGGLEREYAFRRLQGLGFHAVFGHDGIEVFPHDGDDPFLPSGRLPLVQTGTDEEMFSENVFQAVLGMDRQGHSQEAGDTDLFHEDYCFSFRRALRTLSSSCIFSLYSFVMG